MKKNSNSLLIIIIGILLCCYTLNAQVVSILPIFPQQTQNVVITFDATKGNAALIGESNVFAHTGVITNLSSTPNEWRFVQGNWGTNDQKVKMTFLGDNKFQLSINISNYYGVAGNERVKKLAFVFRNLDGSKVGRNIDGSDIFIPISDGSFAYNININPSGSPQILYLYDTLKYSIQTSEVSDINLQIDGLNNIVKTSTQSIDTFYTGASIGVGKHWIKTIINYNGSFYSDSLLIVVRFPSSTNVNHPPIGVNDGINYLSDTTVILQLFAPQKNFVYLMGDFNDWELDPNYEMTRTPDGNRYWIRLDNIKAKTEYAYQYCIDKNQIRVADPYADKYLDPQNDRFIDNETYPNLKSYPKDKTSNYVSVFQTSQTSYNWVNNDFKKPNSESLIIYELLIRDFVGKHNYQALIDTISYLKRLGVNAIELMPFNEFEGNESWGYNTVFYFAPDKYYGTKNKLKEFIDVCHQNGIAVIMDMVLNHSFGQSSMVRMYFNNNTNKPENNPWFNEDAKHPFNVGYDFNHESIYTQNFVDTVLKYWVNEYKIDGYRFDLSKGFTQRNTPNDVSAWSAYDQSRINIWKRISDKLRQECQDCYLILEHFADNNEEKVLSDYGFMFWGNLNYSFTEAAMGYTSDLSSSLWQNRGWNKPNLIRYAESHDEERLMYKTLNFGSSTPAYNTKDSLIALKRAELSAVFLSSMPGPYMIWQFGELGYPYSINTCTNGTVNVNCRLANKPIKWDYTSQPARKRLYDVYSAINKLRSTYKVFSTKDFNYSLNNSVKTLLLKDSILNLAVAGNFGTSTAQLNLNVNHAGWWYNYFDGDSIYLESTTYTSQLSPGNYILITDKRLEKPIIEFSTGLFQTEQLKAISIFPNPTTGILNVQSEKEIINLQITDLIGRIIYNSFQPVNNQFLLSDLSGGSYFLKIETIDGILYRKIIINK